MFRLVGLKFVRPLKLSLEPPKTTGMERVRPARYPSLAALFGHLQPSQATNRPFEVDYRRSLFQTASLPSPGARALEASYGHNLFGRSALGATELGR